MNTETRAAASSANRALAVLAALALALFALGVSAPAAWAFAETLEVTSYEGVYDGQPHSASVSIEGDTEGYSVEYRNARGEELSGAPSLTDVTYGEYTVSLYTLDGQLIDRADFHISIEPRNVTVNVAGDSLDTTYDGDEKSITGFTPGAIEVEEIEGLATPLYTNDDYSLKEGVTAEVTRTNAGTYYMGLTKDDFVNNNANFKATFVVTDGVLNIAPRAVDVFVAGGTGSLPYDGTRQSFEGWEVTSYEVSQIAEVRLPEFDKGSVSLKDGAAGKASGTEVGNYPMGLTAESFECTDPNFDATFHVTDGMLTIVAADEEDGDDKGGKSKKDADEESGEPSGTPKTADAADLALPAALMAGAAAAAMAARSRRRGQE